MRVRLALPALLASAVLMVGCGGETNTSNSSSNTVNTGAANKGVTDRDGAVETNVNMPPNMNGNSAPSNTAVVTNNNGNKNTAGVSTTNGNSHNTNGNKSNSNH